MKLTPPVLAAISIAALLCIVQIELRDMKAANAALSAQLGSALSSVSAIKQQLKEYDASIGPQGTLQVLSRRIDSGEMDLVLKSLRVASNGRTLVSLGSNPDAGGVIRVGSTDGSSAATISSVSGRSDLALTAVTGANTEQVTHMANYGDKGYYLQKGPSEDVAARTDGAGLEIRDDGSALFLFQRGGGNISLATVGATDRARLSIWSEGDPKSMISLSLGPRDASPFLSIAGAVPGSSLTLLPDRFSLTDPAGAIVLAGAHDAEGGFIYVNDKSGARRAIMTSGTEGKGSISVYGSDKRSNTLFPEYDIQTPNSNQK
jgi:hypothetical protein